MIANWQISWFHEKFLIPEQKHDTLNLKLLSLRRFWRQSWWMTWKLSHQARKIMGTDHFLASQNCNIFQSLWIFFIFGNLTLNFILVKFPHSCPLISEWQRLVREIVKWNTLEVLYSIFGFYDLKSQSEIYRFYVNSEEIMGLDSDFTWNKPFLFQTPEVPKIDILTFVVFCNTKKGLKFAKNKIQSLRKHRNARFWTLQRWFHVNIRIFSVIQNLREINF